MNRKLLYPFSDFLLKLLLFKNSIVLYAFENIRSIEGQHKPIYLFASDSFLILFKQNGTERHSKVAFRNSEYPKTYISTKLFPEWNTVKTTANGC